MMWWLLGIIAWYGGFTAFMVWKIREELRTLASAVRDLDHKIAHRPQALLPEQIRSDSTELECPEESCKPIVPVMRTVKR